MLFFYSIVAVDPNSLWQLTQFRCGSWRIFIVAVGEIVSFTYNHRIKYDYVHKKMMQNYKKRRERRGFFGKSGVLFEKSRVTFNTTGITKLLHSCLSR